MKAEAWSCSPRPKKDRPAHRHRDHEHRAPALFEDVDIIQVGARNMQNFELLKQLGRLHKPILLKRGLANTIEELLMSAEYIMAEGNEQVILCERGIRTYETFTRNTLDISAVPVLKKLSHLPSLWTPATPPASTGSSSPCLAAAAIGADASSSRSTTTPATPCATAPSPSPRPVRCALQKGLASFQPGAQPVRGGANEDCYCRPGPDWRLYRKGIEAEHPLIRCWLWIPMRTCCWTPAPAGPSTERPLFRIWNRRTWCT